MRSKKIWANGSFIDNKEAKIHISIGALHYGTSVFEGIICIDIGKGRLTFFRLEDHIDRLFESIKILKINIPYTREEVIKAIIDTVKINKLKSCYIRPIVFRNSDYRILNPRKSSINFFIDFVKFNKQLFFLNMKRNIRLKTSKKIRILHGDILSGVKISGKYLKNAVAYTEATDKGYDDVILLDNKGKVLESSSSNIFVVKNGKIITPPSCSILKGITRDSIIKIAKNVGYHVYERSFTKKSLYDADEIFLTSSSKGIISVSKVDNKKITNKKITKKLRKLYIDIIIDKISEYHNWLTIIDR